MNTQEARIKTARRVGITVAPGKGAWKFVLAIGFALLVSALSGCGVRLVRSEKVSAPQINIAADGSIKPSAAFLHEYENFLLHTERDAARQEKERGHLLAQIPVTHYYDAQRRLLLVRPPAASAQPTAPPPPSSSPAAPAAPPPAAPPAPEATETK